MLLKISYFTGLTILYLKEFWGDALVLLQYRPDAALIGIGEEYLPEIFRQNIRQQLRYPLRVEFVKDIIGPSPMKSRGVGGRNTIF